MTTTRMQEPKLLRSGHTLEPGPLAPTSTAARRPVSLPLSKGLRDGV